MLWTESHCPKTCYWLCCGGLLVNLGITHIISRGEYFEVPKLDVPKFIERCALAQNIGIEHDRVTRIYRIYQKKNPAIWAKLEYAAQEGLVYIDVDSDAVTASNRLLLTYPDLHEVLSTLINQWAECAEFEHGILYDILNHEKKRMTDKKTQAINAVFDSLVEPTLKCPINSIKLLGKMK